MTHTVTATEQTFQQDVLDATVPVLVDFWAEWCGPCKALAPVLDKLAAEFAGRLIIAKVNVDEEQRLAAMAGIRSLPTMLLFVDGQPVDQIVGAQPEANIRAALERVVGTADAQTPPPDAAAEALEDGSGAASLAKLEAVLAEDPDNADAKVAIARIHVVAGRLDEAASVLESLPEEARDTDNARQVSAAHWFAIESQRLADAGDTAGVASAYRAGIDAAVAGRHDDAAEELLGILAKDRKYGDDAGRKALLRLIDLLTSADERVAPLRRRMMTLIY